MEPRRVLIIYGTSYGQTEKIARRIRDLLVWHGCDVTLVNAADGFPVLPLSWFDGIIVGSSIIARGHHKHIAEFIREQGHLLDALPAAFFSVSASAGSKSPAERAAAERVRDEFLERAHWAPHIRVSFAGAVNYTKYNRLLRWYMKRASRKGGGATDTSRDHEYTDWSQVSRFADEFAELVGATQPKKLELVPA